MKVGYLIVFDKPWDWDLNELDDYVRHLIPHLGKEISRQYILPDENEIGTGDTT
jgi:hypothetical protein